MITVMKKYTFLIYHREYEDFLQKIREKGVLHIQQKQEGEVNSPVLQDAMQHASRIEKAMTTLGRYIDPKGEYTPKEGSVEQGEKLLQRFEAIEKEMENIHQKQPALQKEIEQMMPWGDFDFALLAQLKDAGYSLHFFSCQDRDYDEAWDEKYDIVQINRKGVIRFFVVITRPEEILNFNLDPSPIGKTALHELQQRYEALQAELANLKKELQQICNEEMASFEALKREVMAEVEFSKVVLSGEKQADEKLLLLQGWLPEKQESDLNDFLNQQGVFYQSEKPVKGDEVPIQLRNSKFAKLFEPITEMFSLPNYTELDPTPFLAPFFMLFFGLCMGDAGYGLLIWLTSWWLGRKAAPKSKGLFTLGAYLGFSTFVIGILTGSFLGIALDSVTWSWLAGVKQYFITQNNFGALVGGYHPLMILAVIIGIVQILFGMCVAAAKLTKQYGFKYAQSTLAWVLFLITGITHLGISALTTNMSEGLTYVFYLIYAVCAFFIYFYNSPGKGLIANFGSGLWNTYNMATGLLGDTLSYIRLFALGLTGSILGGVFNTLAFDLTSSLPLVPQILGALVILLFGHTINFGLCMIGAFVHPLRLTFVEFYKNAEFEGGGTEFKPFKK
jgi:V/A-type H+-transporting ATPase subunit I